MRKIDTTTKYAGLKLKNPIIIASSELCNRVEKVVEFEKHGAAAVVLKSLFEEQILQQVAKGLERSQSDHIETEDALRNYLTAEYVNNYLQLIRDCKTNCTIPIIASINCYTKERWVDLAKQMEKAGADAIEINLMYTESNKAAHYGNVEQLLLDVLASIKKEVRIPVIVKIQNQFSNLVALANQMQHNDADAVVMFNKPYLPDVDIDKLTHTTSPIFAGTSSLGESLRWIGIVAAAVPKLDLAASTGVSDATNLIKAILVGAKAGQLCSVLYKEGPEVIPAMLHQLEEWMVKHGFSHIEQFRGLLKAESVDGVNVFERTQFMKYHSNGNSFPPR